MDLIEKLQEISDRIVKSKNLVTTEEATKNAFVMPFIQALGYDVFNPLEVVPEFTADIGTKKGEKVDYCICKEGEPAIIIECKHWQEKIDSHTSQLHRYFHTTSARFGIITNGISYKFYSDLEEQNKMDEKPFFEFSFEKLNENVATELKKFKKDHFDVEEIVSTASDLKYSKLIKDLLATELKEPSEDFVKYFAKRAYNGIVTKKIQEQFTVLVQKSAKQLLSEMISDRLKSALDTEAEETQKEIQETEEKAIEEKADNNGIITTEEELEGYRIIQAIIRRKIDLDRVFHRDTKSYFGVLLDDNNRKPICRLHFNSGNKYIGVFDENRNEEKVL
ncbi:type I restriction endonuclease, partial [Xanthovirga aplysinae]|uniref:type I restriction endonuclease n=1 Tax=Xanthovirga aplysinae TaxID=2529853 RepID=UPI0012BCDD56